MELLTPSFAERAAICPLCGGAIDRWSSKRGRRGGVYHYDRCRQCDFAFVNPRPTLQWLSEYYSQDNSKSSSAIETPAPPEPPPPNSPPAQTIAILLELRPPPGRLLDVGAGSGAIS